MLRLPRPRIRSFKELAGIAARTAGAVGIRLNGRRARERRLQTFSTVTHIIIPAADGVPLAATLYQPAGGRSRMAAIIACAMGAPRDNYRHYAAYLASEGWSVVTFDYRGIAGSKHGSLRRCPATIRDWAEQDITGVISWIDGTLHPLRLVAIGHSIGGQIMALARNHQRLDALLTVSAQKGYWKYWDGFPRLALWVFWYSLPLVVALYGYLPFWLAGLKALPRGVALEWQRWGVHPDYLDEHGASLHHRWETFEAPILALSFADDIYFAPWRAVEALLRIYAKAPGTHRPIDPAEFGIRAIGHSGFFHNVGCIPLWKETAEWLRKA
jgi:predicted alpha/beta hydrolase